MMSYQYSFQSTPPRTQRIPVFFCLTFLVSSSALCHRPPQRFFFCLTHIVRGGYSLSAIAIAASIRILWVSPSPLLGLVPRGTLVVKFSTIPNGNYERTEGESLFPAVYAVPCRILSKRGTLPFFRAQASWWLNRSKGSLSRLQVVAGSCPEPGLWLQASTVCRRAVNRVRRDIYLSLLLGGDSR